VTGTTNFAAFTVVAGRRFTVQFDGVLTMTHHATTLDLPGAANITTAAGDVAEFFATGTNTVQCVNYTRASGAAVALADNSITLAKMAGGTDGQIITYDASGDPVAVGPGSDGEVLTSTGAGSPPAFEAAGGGLTLGTAVASTSGATIDFTGIPAGTKKITISYVGVSTTGTSIPMVQIGDSGGIETSAYLGAGTRIKTDVILAFTTGFGHHNDWGDGVIFHGTTVLVLVDASTFTWVGTAMVSSPTNVGAGSGSKSLSAELTQVRITTVGGSDTFDAGKINIQYE
jgi:hypothetical protein